jgi:uroporphyrinogen-III synthase
MGEQSLHTGGVEGLGGLVIGVPARRRAAQTASLVERWGGTPLVGPAVEEVPVGDDETLRAATEAVLAQRPPWSVHLTGTGTRRWFDQAEAWGLLPGLLDVLRAARVIARGRKSARALAEQLVEPAWMPGSETSAEIAAWLGPRVEAGEAVVLQRHGEPSPALSAALEARGAHLIEIVTYRWALPDDREPAEHLVRALAAGEVHALVITSAPQARHLFVLARGLGLDDELRRALVSRVFAGAVGSVAAGGLRAEGVEPDLIATPPTMGSLLRSLAEAREQVLAKNASG